MIRNKLPIFIVCCISFVIFICLFDRSLLESVVLSFLGDFISTNLVTTSIVSGSLSIFGGPAIVLTGVKFQGTSLLMSALIDTLNVRCEPMSLFSSPRCHVSGELYHGQFTGDLTYTDQSNVKGSGQAINLSLGDHPLLHAYGIESGIASITDATFERTVSALKSDQRFSMQLHLENVEKPTAIRLSPARSGLPFPIEIPPLSIKDLKTTIVRSNEFVLVERLTISSSLGEIEGEGTLRIDNNQLKMDSFKAVLTQNEGGKALLLPYLQFICPKDVLEAPTIAFAIKGSAFTCRRQV